MDVKINELQDGNHVESVFLIKSINKGVTSKGSPYLSIIFQDKTGTMDAKYWNVTTQELDLFQAGMIVGVKGDVLSHQGQLQLRIASIIKVDEKSYDMANFVESSPVKKADLELLLHEYITAIQTISLKQVLQALLHKYEERLYVYPAAAKNHHAFVGGLATHIVGMLKLADQVCKLYPLLDKDLLFAGVIAHDLGKLLELSGPIATEYTVEGKLLGHISIMQAEVASLAEELGIAEDESIILLRHLILSHHGQYDYGSPVLPMVPEAEMLHFIDNMDARMNTLEQAFKTTKAGEFTPRIFALENRNFYKHK